MRLILLLFIMIAFVHVQAQFAPNYQEEIERISQMEQKGFQRRLNGDLANARTSASQNFDVKYYRCEWEVDPAVRYIKGVVTTHFVMTSSGKSITLDLADEHIISSVTRNNVALSFTHMNGAVTVSFPVPIAGGVKDSMSIYG
ncbi:hypothetical protein [Dyadobacter sp. CY351]|uniref:hypothetical protein n=1 Tax=Dyadobacter sp. CY351 TaxID=2909337 RepID=UPI001F279491|nr:hypothetical protein [Dyadobacter sp. CY351]MCF2520785.1 hypothetical protein [Dyadobacter sp. CY351]